LTVENPAFLSVKRVRYFQLKKKTWQPSAPMEFMSVNKTMQGC